MSEEVSEAPAPVDDDTTANYRYERRQSLRRLLARQDPIPAEQCIAVIDVALTLLADTYVHLPLKRALYAVDPESRLRLYRRKIDNESLDKPTIEAREFRAEMISTFASLHDRHTSYWAFGGLSDWDAFLPLTVEEYRDSSGSARFVVSAAERDDGLVGADVTHWNGVPIAQAVERLAEVSGGANPEAQRARGIEALTRRPLSTSPLPDEEWVQVTLQPFGGGQAFERCFPWSAGYQPESRPTGAALDNEQADALGLDDDAHRVGQSKRVMVRHPVQTLEPFRAYAAQGYARPVPIGDREYGYVRLFSFLVGDHGPFVSAVEATLRLLPQTGVIVDIRKNAGGNVIAAERLLQLFTDPEKEIEPEPLQIRTTRLLQKLALNDQYRQWARTLDQGVAAGGGYSAGYPCSSDPVVYNDLTWAYPGPAVLIVDALSYSACDFFAAGWQDNGVGKVLGTAQRTGGGGATRLKYTTLRERLDNPPQLPDIGDEHGFTVAVRRSLRVRENAGVLVEDFGVTPDPLELGVPPDPEAGVYRLTRDDVLGGNEGLLARAAELLNS